MAVLKHSAGQSPTAWCNLRASAKVRLAIFLHNRAEDALCLYGDGTTMVPRLGCAAYACVELALRSPHALCSARSKVVACFLYVVITSIPFALRS